MEKMEIYNLCKATPKEAQRTIMAGDLKGFTDINPMYRIRKLTELFGPCGIGWKYTIDKQWSETIDQTVTCYCNISLYYKADDAWSEAIPGTGGSTSLMQTRNGLKPNDEGYKKALTDAISVACKSIGIGADVYWQSGESKYSSAVTAPERVKSDVIATHSTEIYCEECGKPIPPLVNGEGEIIKSPKQVAEGTKKLTGRNICYECYKRGEKPLAQETA